MGRDPHGFTSYVERSNTRLLRAAYLLVGERGAAEDLLQDVFEKLYVAWPRVSTPDAYVHRALANGATSRWRHRVRRPEQPLDAAQPDPHTAADDGLADRDVVVRALATLPDRMRAVMVLRFLEELSEAETAAALGCSLGTVKSQASRGLERLRQHIGQPAEASPSPTATSDRRPA